MPGPPGPPPIIVAGIEIRIPPGYRPAPLHRPRRGPRGPEIDPISLRWVMSRAAEFIENKGKGKLGTPAFSYAELARNFARSRGVKIKWRSLRALIRREDPGLFDLRKYGYLAALPPKRPVCPACGCRRRHR